jgi:hypothetical protein
MRLLSPAACAPIVGTRAKLRSVVRIRPRALIACNDLFSESGLLPRSQPVLDKNDHCVAPLVGPPRQAGDRMHESARAASKPPSGTSSASVPIHPRICLQRISTLGFGIEHGGLVRPVIRRCGRSPARRPTRLIALPVLVASGRLPLFIQARSHSHQRTVLFGGLERKLKLHRPLDIERERVGPRHGTAIRNKPDEDRPRFVDDIADHRSLRLARLQHRWARQAEARLPDHRQRTEQGAKHRDPNPRIDTIEEKDGAPKQNRDQSKYRRGDV